VYTSLLTWLQGKQQQQDHPQQPQQLQQQQPSASEAGARVQEAAAAAAARAPSLLTGVFRQQNKLADGGSKLVRATQRSCLTAASPLQLHGHLLLCHGLREQPSGSAQHCPAAAVVAAVLLILLLVFVLLQVPGAIQAWIGDLLQQTAASAAAIHASQPPDQLQPHCQARPLPDWTVQQLLDRPGAVLRQELADTACAAAAAAAATAAAGGISSSGGLPAVVCRYTLEPDGYEMVRREVPPAEWLAQRCSSNSAKRRRLPGGSGDGAEDLQATEHM
jgi:hypothetical protein